MIDPLTLMGHKIGMLEELLLNLYATMFEAKPDPAIAAVHFAEQYRELYEGYRGPDPEADLQMAEVLGEWLDKMVAEVQRRTRPSAT